MLKNIRKRDGRIVYFDKAKIENTLEKAIKEVNLKVTSDEVCEISEGIVLMCEELYGTYGICSVDEVQDIVIRELTNKGYSDIAKVYTEYRVNRSKLRTMRSSLMKTFEKLTFNDVSAVDIRRENANIDADTAMGTMLKYGSESAKQFVHLFMLDPKHSKAHLNGDIHIHDLDFYALTTTCTQIPLDKLFKKGFNTGHGFLREPQDIKSYSALACIAIQSNQNEQHGGQAIPMLDYYLAPGVSKTFIKKYVELLEDKYEISEQYSQKLKETLRGYIKNANTILDEKGKEFVKSSTITLLPTLMLEAPFFTSIAFPKLWDKAMLKTNRSTYQAMESLIANLNTMHSRAGAQTPFSSINFGTDTTEEGRLVIKNILLATDDGLGKGETPIFPISVFKVKEGINYNPKDPNYDLFKLACKVSAKRLFPNFCFIDAPFNKKYYVKGRPETECTYMGCRTRLLANIFDKDNEVVTGRGNLSFTSINLPRLAIRAGRGNIDKFFELLDDKLELVRDQLLLRFEVQAKKKVKNFPFLMGQGVWLGSEKLGLEDEVRDVLKQGSLGVGYIGLAECLTYLVGKHHAECEKSQELGLKIVSYMKEFTDKTAKDTNLNFAIIATPAEGLSDRFLKIDRDKYGIIDGVTDKDFYTNSNHVPVNYNISAFDKIRLEAPYHALTEGGHITYIELDGDPCKNLDAFESIIRCMKESGIGYGAINHPLDRCPKCEYNGVIYNECPNCGVKDTDIEFDRIRRITGYLVGDMSKWGEGKKAEESLRVKHGLQSRY